MLLESVRLALRSIFRNVLRSTLTLLGIVIGVAAVIAMVTIGNGATQKITSDISKLGSNMLMVRPGAQAPGPPSNSDARSFNERDVDALRSGLNAVRGVTPSASKQGKVTFDAASLDVTITGTDASYFTVQDWPTAQGEPLSETEVRAAANSCVIGQTIVTNLMPSIDPLGQTVRIGTMPCTVVGVLAAKGQSTFGTDQDATIIMPLRTFQRRIAGNTTISNISISANTADDVALMQQTATEILRETRHVGAGEEDDFSVRDLTQLAATFTSTSTLLTGLLGAVAGISLLVGGIGIMNIMLVSVTERTREIGIRLAIGATARQVLMQFLIEAVVLCFLGGAIGIALGLGLAAIASSLMSFPFDPSYSIVLLAFGFSGLIGLIFGYFPARRAAQLDPIEALRHE